jgi:ATP-dependent exoDNAse (exonuclease V) alpha subunit
MSRLNIYQQVANNLFQHFINSKEQLLLRLEGCGGTGKSFLLESWRQQVATIVLLAAPTGIAAHLIEGETLHSLLSLPTNYNFQELSMEKKRDREHKFKDVKLIIVDEYSMIGCKMISRIESRLRQISGRPQEPFRGYHVILVADTLQLPPVGDTPLWYSLSTNEERTDENIAGLAAYRAFEKVINLTIQVRQAGESQSVFRRILDNLRKGESTLEDWQVLNTRMINAYGTEERAALDQAIYMFSANKEAKDYNSQKLGELLSSKGERTCRINAYHSSPTAQNIDADDFSGLEASLCLARGCKVMITANLWTQYGIANGAIGHVRHIIFGEGEGPTNLAQYVIVEMSSPLRRRRDPRCSAWPPRLRRIYPTCVWSCSGSSPKLLVLPEQQ